MDREKTTFRISFRGLLSDVTQALKWPQPIYNQPSCSSDAATLVLLRNNSPNAAFFRGATGKCIAESEEQAAEEAVDFLVQKKQVIIEDVNLDSRNKYKACCQFYKEKREAIESLAKPNIMGALLPGYKKKVHVPSTLPKIVVADMWNVWLDVAAAYDVTTDDVDFVTKESGVYVCCFAVSWPDHALKERHFIGDCCDTLKNAKNSLAKKAIQYFQSIYGFVVKDANFNRMKYSEIQSGFQRRRYLSAKEEHAWEACDLHSENVYIADGWKTPEGGSFMIRAGLSLPPASKKLKRQSEVLFSGLASENAVAESSLVVKNPNQTTIH